MISALPLGVDAPVRFRVLGPDTEGLSSAELRRLFRGQRMTQARRNRLGQGGRILAFRGRRVVGLAAYERTDRELRVEEVGIDSVSPRGASGVADALLDALELGCVAGSVRRLILLSRLGLIDDVLRRRGYAAVAAVASGIWFEKRFV